MAKRKKRDKTILAIIIGVAIVSFWRGVWGLMDLYLFPHNPLLSLIASLVIGLGVLIATHVLIKEYS